MKKPSPSSEMAALHAELQRDIDRWNDIKQNGCNDPFWPDGVNMNLKRNHIINDLRRLAELEQKPIQISMFMTPEQSQMNDVMNDSRIPPKVPENYMVRDKYENWRRIKVDNIPK